MDEVAERHRISEHPNVNFTVVINPGSGPGPDALPDANYTREIPKLVSFDNVRVLGYVATTWATRNISLVRKDIETYAAWPTNSSNPNLAVRGIFFDETPQQFNASALNYLQNLTDFVKDTPGLGPDHYVRATLSPPLAATSPMDSCPGSPKTEIGNLPILLSFFNLSTWQEFPYAPHPCHLSFFFGF